MWAERFVIQAFDVNLTLGKDGWLNVEERITVRFDESARGIFRTIPLVYETGRGVARRPLLTGISVVDGSGRGLKTQESSEGRYRKVRIGNPNIWLPAGTVTTYVIRYRVYGVLNWLQESPDWQESAELYWNVTGDEWPVPIERASAVVRFPGSPGGAGLRARVFVGPLGSTLQDTATRPVTNQRSMATQTSLTLSDSMLRVERFAPLAPYEGMTVVLSVPANLVPRPSFWQSAKMFLLANLGFTTPVWVLLILLVAWFRLGRDPHPGPLVVQFEPPDGLSGAECGVLIDERADQRDLAAILIGLAVKGCLTIRPEETGMIFKRRKAELTLTGAQPSAPLSAPESTMLAKLAKCSAPIDEVEMRAKVAPAIGEIWASLYGALVSRGYYLGSPQTVRGVWTAIAILLAVAIALLFVWLSPFHLILPSVIGGAVAAVLGLIIAQGMPRRTPMGAKVRRQVEGFREFIQRARGREFDWMSKKHPDQSLFEEYLPHAIAFGLATEWSEAFAGIAHVPDWYLVEDRASFHPAWFASDIGTVGTYLSQAASTPPRSSGASGGGSGFGGGGFSGGGFGGGGGGSW